MADENLDYNDFLFDGEDPEFSALTEEQREEIKHQSMENTFKLITNNYDFEVFPNRLFWLLTDYDELTVFDVLIDYFADPEREQYERCAILKKIKERHLRNTDKTRAAKRGMFTYRLGTDEK
jgi:hypothetical protein